ncbi:hypothetical protein CU666_25925 [Pseudomonas syringae pv. actinidifoliorum]|nr:hypothetical protein [Pseudomonas syringae pv. actinidifoliorum]
MRCCVGSAAALKRAASVASDVPCAPLLPVPGSSRTSPTISKAAPGPLPRHPGRRQLFRAFTTFALQTGGGLGVITGRLKARASGHSGV